MCSLHVFHLGGKMFNRFTFSAHFFYCRLRFHHTINNFWHDDDNPLKSRGRGLSEREGSASCTTYAGRKKRYSDGNALACVHPPRASPTPKHIFCLLLRNSEKRVRTKSVTPIRRKITTQSSTACTRITNHQGEKSGVFLKNNSS